MRRRNDIFVRGAVVTLLVGFFGVSGPRAIEAQEPVVHAVLFFSPTCPHCHKVLSEDLPPLKQKYGDRLMLAGVDVTTPRGHDLFEATVAHFDLKPPRYGVPTLVVGADVMVGDREIPERFPGLVEKGLAEGGVDWPDVPALRSALMKAETATKRSRDDSASVDTTDAAAADAPARDTAAVEPAIRTHLASSGPPPGPLALFRQDPVGNGIAVLVLFGLIGALVASALAAARSRAGAVRLPSWTIPVLATIGMGVASYLAFVEVTGHAAVCGPVGDCNVVQQSSYATLFGLLPVGMLGQMGYLGMFFAWGLAVLGPPRLVPLSWSVLWGMAFVGTAFSVYLTFLEPFVIGATCVWCLTSAVVVALILLAATPRAVPNPGVESLSS